MGGTGKDGMTHIDEERGRPGPPVYGDSPEERKRRGRILPGAEGKAPQGRLAR